MSGIVSFSKLSISEGIPVKGGEVLINISSKNIVDGDPISKARSAFEIAKINFDRAELLIKDKLISEKEYNEIKLNYENAKIAYQAFAQKGTTKGIAISSSISGYLKTKLVNEGQYVEVGQPLLIVTQNRKLQLRADVSERYYKDLGGIYSANFKTPYSDTVYKLVDLNGKLVSFGKSASNQSNYIPVNFEFNNIGQIISGSYVEVFLLGNTRDNVISIPVTSITEEQGLYFVYLQLDKEGYKKQEVKLGASNGDSVEILSGIKSGDRVVSNGVYNIKLSAASGEIPHGHEH
jgi:RND family efflux transporter MFP subunit